MTQEEDKVVSIFSLVSKEIDQLPQDQALEICKSTINALQGEVFRLMKELAAKSAAQ